jgi:hypothetical protein
MTTVEMISLLLINSTIGLAFGLSFSLAEEIFPGLARVRPLSWVAIAAWGVAILALSLLDHPGDLVGRRLLNSFTTLWIAYLLCRHAHLPPRHAARRSAPPPEPPPAPEPTGPAPCLPARRVRSDRLRYRA